jgi:TolB-like protein
MLESGRNPAISDRRGLATSFNEAGEKISLHGIEAWFKHTDSNYRTPKDSLHPDLKSYAIPRRRWRVILDLFQIPMLKIGLPDDEFKEWCFSKPDKAALRHERLLESRGESIGESRLITDRPSIAVLPFVNTGGDVRIDSLVDGLAEDIIQQLARMPEMYVIPRSTIQGYREQTLTSERVAEELRVRYMLEGRVRRSGEALRIVVEMIDTLSGSIVWSQHFDEAGADIFKIQDNISLQICAYIEPILRLHSIRGYRNSEPKAWQLWQHGWHDMYISSPLAAPFDSIAMFQKSVTDDPEYALAHVGIATGLAVGMLWGGIGPEALPEAKHHAEIAFKLLPESPAVLFGVAMITFLAPAPMTVPLEYLEHAVKLEPSNVVYQSSLGYLEAMTGSAEKGLDRCRFAIDISPKDAKEPFICYMLSNAMISNGHYKDAISTMARSRMFSTVDWVWVMTGFAHFMLGDEQSAKESLREAIKVGKRSFSFYSYSIKQRLWPQVNEADKDSYLALFPQMGIN